MYIIIDLDINIDHTDIDISMYISILISISSHGYRSVDIITPASQVELCSAPEPIQLRRTIDVLSRQQHRCVYQAVLLAFFPTVPISRLSLLLTPVCEARASRVICKLNIVESSARHAL